MFLKLYYLLDIFPNYSGLCLLIVTVNIASLTEIRNGKLRTRIYQISNFEFQILRITVIENCTSFITAFLF